MNLWDEIDKKIVLTNVLQNKNWLQKEDTLLHCVHISHISFHL